ncbi:hypothetical protein LJB76_01935, partial [Clostridia bacterium OttesenSCG-928-O13]|nr:hypothetical protein [Clostridia bacterium OttesenSCG-928-O13]
MLRTQDGTLVWLEDQGNAAETITFEIDHFSPYTLVFKDNATTEPSMVKTSTASPQTGDNNSMGLWV